MGFTFLRGLKLKRGIALPFGMAMSTFLVSQGLAQVGNSSAIGKLNIHPKFQDEPTSFALDWNTSLKATDSFQERMSRNTGFEWNLSFDGRYHFNDNFRIKINPSLKIQNGYVFGSESTTGHTSKLALNEANLGLENQHSKVLIGINSSRNINSFIGAQKSYSGIQADYLADLQYLKMGPAAQTYLLSGGNSDENANSAAPPSFSYGGLKIESYILALNIKLKAQHGFFQYRNLDSSIAQNNEPLGSSIKQKSLNDSEFLYFFKGTESSLNLHYQRQKSLEAYFGLSLVSNSEAPLSHNKAQSLTLGLSKRLASKHVMTWEGSRFQIESDSLPATESDFNVGTNRIGFENSLIWTNTDQEWRIKLSQSKANPIEENLNQDQIISTSITWETFHAEL